MAHKDNYDNTVYSYFLFLFLVLILPCVGGLVTTTVQSPHLPNELNSSHIPASYPLFFSFFC